MKRRIQRPDTGDTSVLGPTSRLDAADLQLKRSLAGLSYSEQLRHLRPERPLQLSTAGASRNPDNVREAAATGLEGPSGGLPFLSDIQRSFGHHDVSDVQAHVGSKATAANRAMGAVAYASGNHVAFRDAPDLRTAAHEAAHVVQQRRGVQLRGGVGEIGDVHERNADAVADAVVQKRSAEALLDPYASGKDTDGECVQMRALSITYPGGRIAADFDEITAQRRFTLIPPVRLEIPIGTTGGLFILSTAVEARIGGTLTRGEGTVVDQTSADVQLLGRVRAEFGAGLPYVVSATVGGELGLRATSRITGSIEERWFTTTATEIDMRGDLAIALNLLCGVRIAYPLTDTAKIAVFKVGDYDSRTGEYDYFDFEIPEESPLWPLFELIETIVELADYPNRLAEALQALDDIEVEVLEDVLLPFVAYFQMAYLVERTKYRYWNWDLSGVPPWDIGQTREEQDQELRELYEFGREAPFWRESWNINVEYFDNDPSPYDALYDWLVNVSEEQLAPIESEVRDRQTGPQTYLNALKAPAGPFFQDPRDAAVMAAIHNRSESAYYYPADIREMSIQELTALAVELGWLRWADTDPEDHARSLYRIWLRENGFDWDPLAG